MQCSKCRRTAIVFQEYSGQYLCQQHFEADLETKAKHEIRRHQWMSSGDHIAVALSGDSVSSALLYFLKKLTANRRDIRISAISIDEGIAGHRPPKCALHVAEQLGTECIMGSFKEQFGKTLDEIIPTKGTDLACIYCRVLRNFLLMHIAMENRITKLAFATTLDQEAVSVLKNVLKGNPEILVGQERRVREKITWIRPFLSVPRKEVAVYADLHVKGCEQFPCPYSDNPFDEDVQIMLNDFSVRHPATKYSLLSLEKNLAGACSSMAASMSSCSKCGELTEGICQSCRIIDEVTAHGS